MARIDCRIQKLKLRHVFRIARSSSSLSQTVLCRIKSGALTGLGEGSPQAYYAQTPKGTQAAIRRYAKQVDADPWRMEDIQQDMAKRLQRQPSARCAIDIALHDLLGKRLKVPLWKLWGLDPNKAVKTSFTIGIAPLDEMLRKLDEAADYPILKIKTGFDGDIETLRAIRKAAPKKIIRVDANCGYDWRTAVQRIKQMEKLDIEFVEQPLPKDDFAGYKKLHSRSGLPLVADESCLVAADIPNLIPYFDGINIKLTKCGGLWEAKRMIHTARACGLKIMLGCMIESSVLITAAAHLTPLVDWADLDGNLLIANDPASGVTCKKGRLILPKGPGLGVKMKKNG